VAERLGLERRSWRKPRRYWQNPANVDRDLLAFIAEHGQPGVMPTQQQMVQAGRADLSLAITRSGGQRAAAARLLDRLRQPGA
jgi:hypothetical protein